MNSTLAADEETWSFLEMVESGQLDWTIRNLITGDKTRRSKTFKCKGNNQKELEWFFEFKIIDGSNVDKLSASAFLHLNVKDEDLDENEIHMVDFSVRLVSPGGGDWVLKTSERQIFKKDNTVNGWPIFTDTISALDIKLCLKTNDQIKLECWFKYYHHPSITEGEIIPSKIPSECIEVAELSDNLRSLLNYVDPKFSDVTLCVGETQVPSHKNILSARSPVFATLFENDMLENRENRVDIKDMKPEVLKKMLEFIYTGRASNIDEMAQDLLVAADHYDLKKLKTHAEINLASKLSTTNAIELLIFADTYRANRLKEKATTCIVENIRKIRETPDWQRMVEEKLQLVDHIFGAVVAKHCK